MSTMDETYQNAYLDAAFGTGHHSGFPNTMYLALFLAGDIEVSGGAYARAAVTNNNTNFPAASGGEQPNGVAITFPTATADWGTIEGHKWMDASSGGEVIHGGAILTPTPITSGMTANFPIGYVVVYAFPWTP